MSKGENSSLDQSANGAQPNCQREWIYIDSAYSVDSLVARRHESFLDARHRDGYFGRVWGVHPQVGLLNGAKAGAVRIVRTSSRQWVLDGFVPGRKLPRWRLPLNMLAAHARLIGAMVRLARRPQVVAIFATCTFYNGLLAKFVSMLSGKPYFVATYGNQDELYEATKALAYPRLLPFRWLELIVQRSVLRSAEFVEAPTLNLQDHMLRRGAHAERIAVVPVIKYIAPIHRPDPASRPSPDAWLREHGVPIRNRYLLCIGRLLELKHADDAVRAMQFVLERDADAVGLMAGDGPLRDELTRMIDGAGLSGRLFLLGLVDQDVLSALIPRTITLSPLTGMALIETSLGGSPPVAYDRDWQPEFVRDGENGFLVPFRDHRAMGERALQLLQDDALYTRLAQQVRSDALTFADIQVNAAREHAALDAALARHAWRPKSLLARLFARER